MRIDASHVPSGIIDQMWVGDATPPDEWPFAPIPAGAGNVIQTSGPVLQLVHHRPERCPG